VAVPVQAGGDAESGGKRVVLKVTPPGGTPFTVTQVDGEMAFMKSPTLSLGLRPLVKGHLVAVAIHEVDAAGKPADKPIATVTGEIGQSLTVQFESDEEPLRIVPEKVY
jgi:hypothetical protein